MRSTKFLVLGLVLSVGLFFSCNKEQMAFNKLAGKWKMEKAVVNGTSQTPPASYIMYLIFGDCDAGATCTVTNSVSTDGGATFDETSSTFTLSDDGKQIISDDMTMTIEKLTKTELELSGSNGGDTFGYTLKKQ